MAANTQAWWLVQGGFDVTVVERASEFRDGGQNIDARGPARTVLERMGLREQVRRAGTGETAWTFVDEDSRVVAKFEQKHTGADAPTAELEILRGDLARLLHDQVRAHVDYRFGDAIAAVYDDREGAFVRFTSGEPQHFDLVVVAEGVGSSTRELVFDGESETRWMDVAMGYFTIPKGHGDGDEARWYNAPGGRSVFLRPDNRGTTRAVLTLQGEPRSADERTAAEQKAWLKEVFADAPRSPSSEHTYWPAS